jgi:hypothetical protein
VPPGCGRWAGSSSDSRLAVRSRKDQEERNKKNGNNDNNDDDNNDDDDNDDEDNENPFAIPNAPECHPPEGEAGQMTRDLSSCTT